MRSGTVRTEPEQLIEIFRALGEPLRLEIVRRMSAVDELPCTVLEAELPISKSTISYHMKLLYNAGLIDIRKDGRYYHYRLRRDLMNHYVQRFLDDVAPGLEVPAPARVAPAVSRPAKRPSTAARTRAESKATPTKTAALKGSRANGRRPRAS